MKRAAWLLFAAALAPALAAAETVYVTDQLTVALRADATPASAVIKTVATGDALEVLERGVGLVRVRDAQGVEGWIEVSALAAQPPAASLVRGLRGELERTRAQLIQAQTQLDKSKVAAAAGAGAGQLQAELSTARSELTQLQDELKKKDEELARLSAAPPALEVVEDAEVPLPGSGFRVLWLVIAFAMLVLGFIGGMVWVRESIRRRMGGLYLRI